MTDVYNEPIPVEQNCLVTALKIKIVRFTIISQCKPVTHKGVVNMEPRCIMLTNNVETRWRQILNMKALCFVIFDTKIDLRSISLLCLHIWKHIL